MQVIAKYRTIPMEILIYEAITRRLPDHHPRKPEFLSKLNRWKAGYKGEKEVDYFLMWAFVSLFALLIGWRIMRQLGGITGDVVGAEIEISESLGLIFLLFIF